MKAFARTLLVGVLALTQSTAAQVTRGVSWGPSATAVGGDSAIPSLSRDGRWIAFESAAGNLAGNDTNGVRDVFLMDRSTGAVTLVSQAPNGVVGNAASHSPSVSGDGTVVAFASDATNLGSSVPGPRAYVFNRATSQIQAVPLAADERLETRDLQRRFMSLSADGRFIAFAAYRQARSAYTYAVLFDRVQGVLTRWPETSIGGGVHPRLNAAGNLLVMESRTGLRFVDLSSGSSSDLSNGCGYPAVSDSGRWVAYECGGLRSVHLHDRLTSSSVEVSAPPAGATRRHSMAPEISADGRFVTFTSFTRLTASETVVGGVPIGHVYRFDRDTGTVELMSKDQTGAPLRNGAYAAAMDATGTLLAFSTPQDVDVTDSNGRDDVYLVDPTCQYSVSPTTAIFPPAGGQLALSVSTQAGCLWRSETGIQSFVGVSAPGGGTGAGAQSLGAAANVSGAVRTGTVSVAGRTVSVSQNPVVAPSISVQPVDAAVAVGGTALFQVVAVGDPTPTYQWQISSDGSAWFNAGNTAGMSGTTTSQLTVANVAAVPFWNRFRAVAANIGGSITSQAARLTATPCTYSTPPGDSILPPGGGAGFVDLVTAPACAWTANTSAGWLTVTPATGTGSARITYAAGPNTTGTQRIAQMFIAGQSSVVRQASSSAALAIATTALPPATVGVPYSAALTASGGVGAINWGLESGGLPSGLSLSPGGTISGTTTVAGTANFTVRVTDATSATATRALSIAVAPAPGNSAPALAPGVVNRPNLTLTWSPPSTGPAPTAYTVVASPAPGGPLVAQLPVGTQTSLTVSAPDGTFYVRVVATVNGAPVSSNEIRVDIAPPALPVAPQSLTAVVAGSVITFTWQAPPGSLVAGYVLEAGTGPNLSNLATLPLGNTTSFSSPPVPNGSYYVRVRALNSTGLGPASNEVRAVVGPPPPSAPTLSGSGGVGGTVTLSWSVPASGAAVSGYQLQAGSVPGASNVAVVNFPSSQTALVTGGVPPGTYYVRVLATSASGLGTASNELVLTVP